VISSHHGLSQATTRNSSGRQGKSARNNPAAAARAVEIGDQMLQQKVAAAAVRARRSILNGAAETFVISYIY